MAAAAGEESVRVCPASGKRSCRDRIEERPSHPSVRPPAMDRRRLTAALVGLVLVMPGSHSANDSSTPAEPMLLSEIATGNRSRYHDQLEFINRFLLSSMNATSDDNNTTPNEIRVIPVPSVVDELPVHPRIPRRSQRRRSRINKHRHSTRVYPDQPVRILLPPSENQIPAFQKTIRPLSENPIVVVSTSETPSTEIHRFEVTKLEESTTQSAAGSGPQHRRVFIPPPLRYLLPPFFYENYISAQQTTRTSIGSTVDAFSPVTANYVPDEFKPYGGNQTETSTRLAPIIVIETVSEPDDIKYWDQEVYLSVEPTTSPPNVQNTKAIPSSTPTFDNQFVQNSDIKKIPSSNSNYKDQFAQNNNTRLANASNYDYDTVGNYYSSDTEQYIDEKLYNWPTTAQTSLSTKPSFDVFDKKLGRNSQKTTLPTTQPSRSIDPYPILTGPNIEQTLFETGEFYSFNSSKDNSRDSTVTMMDRPLLSQEVAKAGMKITANLKEEQIREDKLSRGKLKYSHFKQFKFHNHDGSSGKDSDVLKLQVAESSYYDGNRRPVTQTQTHDNQEFDIQAIPGSPGRDYPTLSKPPAGSGFSCHSVDYHRGYLADPSTGCQVFYICVGNGPGEAMLCPNGTLFSQDFLVCDWWYNVDCQPLART